MIDIRTRSGRQPWSSSIALAAAALLVTAALLTSLQDHHQASALHAEGHDEEREFDLVIFGATGYVGSLLTASLVGDASKFLSITPGANLNSGAAGVRFALAGRNFSKLGRLCDDASAKAGLPIDMIVADSNDPASLDRLASRSKVVITTVAQAPSEGSGFGEGSLLMRCIQHGTHLVDLDGFWTADAALVQAVDAAARATGSVYSPASGEVAVLADLLTYRAWASLSRPPLRKSTVTSLSFNGVASARDAAETSIWAPYNEPVVRLSAAALGYGPSFDFVELSPTNAAHSDWWNNRLAARRRAARFVMVAQVEAEDGRVAAAAVSGGEVDYEETARLALEMALCLLRDRPRLPAARAGGVWAPAAGWGDTLLARLGRIGLEVVPMEPSDAHKTLHDALERHQHAPALPLAAAPRPPPAPPFADAPSPQSAAGVRA